MVVHFLSDEENLLVHVSLSTAEKCVHANSWESNICATDTVSLMAFQPAMNISETSFPLSVV